MLEDKKVRLNPWRTMKNRLIIIGAKVKKRYFTPKTAAFTVTKMNELLVKELSNALGKEQAMDIIFRGAAELGHEYMVELSALLESNLKTMPAYAEAAWTMFSGHGLKNRQLYKSKIAGFDVLYLKFRDPKCPWCKDIQFDIPFCTYPAGAYNGAGQTWAELTNSPYNFFVRELTCKAQGSDYCEFLFLACPKDMPIEVLKSEHPEWFETIDYGFFEF